MHDTDYLIAKLVVFIPLGSTLKRKIPLPWLCAAGLQIQMQLSSTMFSFSFAFSCCILALLHSAASLVYSSGRLNPSGLQSSLFCKKYIKGITATIFYTTIYESRLSIQLYTKVDVGTPCIHNVVPYSAVGNRQVTDSVYL